MLKLGRCLLRCVLFGGIAVGVTADWVFLIFLAGRRRDHVALSRVLNRWARRTAWVAGCRVKQIGVRPTRGLCVSNHVSYIDIPAHASAGPALLVSKRDVLFWPVFGQLAYMCGTLFIQREKRGDVANVSNQMEAVMKTGVPLIVFPEGTSSDGRDVLPFKSSLFQPAIDHQWPVTPMWIGYELEGGSVEREVAYFGDMTLFPHLMNLFTKRGLQATIVYGEPITDAKNRKELCQKAHEAVVKLGQGVRAAPRQSAGMPG
jgi:1-acyl-sn-glycerol-3-phosphate acyltransferase